MGKYFITGNAGTGKSTVIAELQRKGYKAIDIDDYPDIHGYLDRQTGSISDTLPKSDLRGAEAFARYASVLKEKELRALLGRNENETIFLGGSVSNQSSFYGLFDRVFGLILDNDSLEARLAQRTNNTTGNDTDDRAYLLSINERSQRNLREAGAIIIDASKTVDAITAEILSHVHDN